MTKVHKKEFDGGDGPALTEILRGRTVVEVVIEEGFEDYMIIKFTNGVSMRVRYEYIYDWEVLG